MIRKRTSQKVLTFLIHCLTVGIVVAKHCPEKPSIKFTITLTYRNNWRSILKIRVKGNNTKKYGKKAYQEEAKNKKEGWDSKRHIES